MKKKLNSTYIENELELENNLINIIQLNLLEWYNNNKRDLPFRINKDPYKIWVSEVMLQQTRISAMLPSYHNFINKIPSIEDLAKSNEDDVLSLWKGLGYYSRAKNLKKGAEYILNNHNGIFPKDLSSCLKIPGIGSYTANAILSIAFDIPLAVLDGNVKRVISRLLLYEKNISSSSSHHELQRLADNLLNKENPGDHNQAMMELGALICTPTPNCSICPLNLECISFKKMKQNLLPIIKKEDNRLSIEMRFFLLKNNENEVLIYTDKNRRFFKTISTLPYLILGKNLSSKYEESDKLRENFLKSINSLPKYLKKKHSITNHDIILSYVIKKVEDISIFPNSSIFIKLDELEVMFPSSIAKKILADIKSEHLF